MKRSITTYGGQNLTTDINTINEIVDKEIAAGEGVYTPEGREELVEDDEITAEEVFYMEGRDQVFKKKAKGYTNNPEIQEQWKED